MRRKGVQLTLETLILTVILIVLGSVLIYFIVSHIFRHGSDVGGEIGEVSGEISGTMSGITVRIDKIEDSGDNCTVTVEVLDRKMRPKSGVTITLYELGSGGAKTEIDSCETGVNGKCPITWTPVDKGNYSVGTESEQKLFMINNTATCDYEIFY